MSWLDSLCIRHYWIKYDGGHQSPAEIMVDMSLNHLCSRAAKRGVASKIVDEIISETMQFQQIEDEMMAGTLTGAELSRRLHEVGR